MSYEIKFSPKAFKNIERLPKGLQTRIFDKFALVKEDPFRYVEHFAHERYYRH